jgi:23S rRNA (uracil1939-C5)-methyltransferase
MNALHRRLEIERLGQKGEGLAHDGRGLVFVPYALAGEVVIADVDGDRGRLAEIIVASPDRIAPLCAHFSHCGGCAVQTLAPAPYAQWKRDLVIAALAHVGIDCAVAPLVDAHGEGRRRATFHARFDQGLAGRARTFIGFMQARSHQILPITECPILAPGMAHALPAARLIADVLADHGKPLDLVVTATNAGLDLDLHGAGKLPDELRQRLITAAAEADLARLSNHGLVLIERRAPQITMGVAQVVPPPGGFLQATQAGEEALAAHVLSAIGKVKRVADLFAGVGTFALRLAEKSEVLAVESEAAAIAALTRAAHRPGLRQVRTETRDLFRRPLLAAELNGFDAVVFDPPRSGAKDQSEALAQSQVPCVVAVSCSVQSFARDARSLIDGGYVLESVTPFDQFRHSAHVEIIGVFRRPVNKGKKRGRLLG